MSPNISQPPVETNSVAKPLQRPTPQVPKAQSPSQAPSQAPSHAPSPRPVGAVVQPPSQASSVPQSSSQRLVHQTAHPTPRPIPSRPIDLVAIDIDGTLLRSDKTLSLRVAHAIEKVTAKGVKVVLASARPPRSVNEVHRKLNLDTYQINYNGALIYDNVRSRNVFHQPLSPAIAQKIIKAARKADPKVVVSMEILDKWYTDHVDESLPTETSRHFMPDFVGPLEAFWHVPMTKLMLLAPPERMAKISKVVSTKFKGQVALAISDKHLLQVIALGVDKSTALAKVAAHYNIPAARVMAIGDAPNDVGMIRWAGLGIAMGNGWDATRKVADMTIPTNDEDGVAFALKKYVLGI